MTLTDKSRKLVASLSIGGLCALLFCGLAIHREHLVKRAFEHARLTAGHRQDAAGRDKELGYPWLESLEQWTFDRFMRLYRVNEKAPKIVAVNIDTASLRFYRSTKGRWPWSRLVWAQLLEALQQAKARAVIFDLIFSEPNPSDRLGKVPAWSWHKNKSSHDVGVGDVSFAEVLRYSEIKNTFLSYHWLYPENDDPARFSLAADADPVARLFFADELHPVVRTPLTTDALVCRKTRAKLSEMPFPVFWLPTVRYGWIDAETDPDGRLRRTTLVHAPEAVPGTLFPAIALSAVLSTQTTASGEPLVKIEPDGSVTRGGVPLPRDRLGFYSLPLCNSFPKRFRNFSILRILETITMHKAKEGLEEAREEKDEKEIKRLTERLKTLISEEDALDFSFVKDAFVVVGTWAPGMGDLYPTPFEPVEPGMVKHCATIDALLHGNLPRRVPLWIVLAIIGVLPLLMALAYAKCSSPLQIEVVFLAIAIVYAAISAQLYSAYRYQLDVAVVELCLLLHFVLTLLFKYFVEDRQRRIVNQMFGKYMSPEIVKRLVENPELVKPGGQRRQLTALFSDLANFTSMSEILSPEELVVLLNEYLDAMTNDIIRGGGYLDKYMGDGIMAVFGIHESDDDHLREAHAFNACKAAIENQRQMTILTNRWEAEGKPHVSVRIGLNTGPMVAGNVGSEAKMNYTIIGDAVNLASRLEGANKKYGTDIMIGEETYEVVKDLIVARELDILAVKGKKQGVAVYELIALCEDDKGDEARDRLLEHYARGLRAYRARDWTLAKKHFLAGIAESPEDGPCWTYVARCEDFEKKPPPADWDGVFRMQTK